MFSGGAAGPQHQTARTRHQTSTARPDTAHLKPARIIPHIVVMVEFLSIPLGLSVRKRADRRGESPETASWALVSSELHSESLLTELSSFDAHPCPLSDAHQHREKQRAGAGNGRASSPSVRGLWLLAVTSFRWSLDKATYTDSHSPH